jgi:hypothetical protein
VIPVDAPWHFTTWLDLLDHWQTGITGVLALAAGFGTVVATMIIARRQIAEAREEADRVIAATREQTKVTAEQTETTVRLERERVLSEAEAFRVVLEAALDRVLDEAAWARNNYPDIFTLTTGASVDAYAVRQCITKGGFAELRAACVTQGGPLTGEFLDLERHIDSFAAQCVLSAPTPVGMHAGLVIQLNLIETMATNLGKKAAVLRQKAAEG